MGLFQEYLDSKGKVKNPVVDISGDQIDPKSPPKSPPKGGKPYIADGSKKGKKGCNKGFAEMGDSDLKYMPSTTGKGKSPAKIPTVEQVELASILADALSRDDSFVERFVYEAKMRGVLGKVIAECLQHKATYNFLAEVMAHKSHGPVVCEKLVRAMNGLQVVSEEVSPPFSDQVADTESDFEDESFGDEDPSNEEGLDDETLEEPQGEPCMACNPDGSQPGMDPECPECGGTGFMEPEMGDMGDMGADMGINQDAGMMPPVGGQMPPAPNPLMNGRPAMRNFQRAMMRRW